ncbi:hypothetical protein [Streptomyces resistomycificus]|uniref:Uncharacterized protein n=1 Tax=Streptomyces resistomycificus TaxID=67356 RepID=A0A0L8L5I8_9ACTN|nr:hypothetical protein [Streptomyces resistomycificus]KOG33336.1 hypothetical protein ADK37_23465 [Streptomyces resistomycificus]KUN99547.1 hypothetical protein AQJ84_11405 [Streptomyces resistomycificus]
MTAPSRPIADLDVPLSTLKQRIADLVEQSHQLDPLDTAFADLACACPAEACGCDQDYPDWAAALAAQPTYYRPQETP